MKIPFSYFFLLALFMVACSQLSQKQEPNLLLKEETFASNIPIEKTYVDTFFVTIGSKSVPLKLTWTTYLDSSQHTTRFIGYTVQRIGGSTDVHISVLPAYHDETIATHLNPEEVVVSGASNEPIAKNFDDMPNAPGFTTLHVSGTTLIYEGITKHPGSFSISVHSDGKVMNTGNN
jgi:hypothetical protein